MDAIGGKQPAVVVMPPAIRPTWAPLAGYLALSLLLIAPVLSLFNSAIPGGPVAAIDGWQNVWNLWWVSRALHAGTNPFFSPLLYYPDGVDLTLQTLNITNGVLGLPIERIAGPTAAYNLCVLLAFTLAGYGAYRLALRLTGAPGPAFLAGLVFSFSPFHLTKLWDGQLELVALQWIPFYALALLRVVEDRRWRDVGLAVACLVAVGLTSWYYLLFCAVYSILFVALWVLTTAEMERRLEMLGCAALVAVGAGVALAPIVLPALRAASEANAVYQPDNPGDPILTHSADLVDFWLPSVLHPLLGGLAAVWGQRVHPTIAGWNVALGYVALGLALLGLWGRRRAAWRWGVLLLATLMLALGPVLQVAGRNTGFPLPYVALLWLPGLGVARRPSHFVVLATLLLALLVAYGASWLLGRVHASYRRVVLVGLAVLVGLEYVPRAFPLLHATVHPYYATLAGSTGALLDLPPRNESSEPLQAQIVHGLPIVGGFVSRTPVYFFSERVPGVRQLWMMQPAPDIVANPPGSELAALNYYRVQHVVVHPQRLSASQQRALAGVIDDLLAGSPPAYRDGELLAYRIPRGNAVPFAYLGPGWYELEQGEGRRWRWMGDSAEVVLVNPLAAPVPVVVGFEWHSFQRPRALDLHFDGQVLGSLEVVPMPSARQFRLLLPPGEHRLAFQAVADVEPAPAGRRLSVAVLRLAVWET